MADPYIPDALFMPVLMALRDCLCAELKRAGRDANCDCTIVPGPPASPADSDAAWVGLVQQFQSATFPQPFTGFTDVQKPWAASMSMGILRSVSLTTMGAPRERWDVIADKQAADMQILRRAILCCVETQDRDFVIGPLTPLPYEGGTYGATLDFTVSG